MKAGRDRRSSHPRSDHALDLEGDAREGLLSEVGPAGNLLGVRAGGSPNDDIPVVDGWVEPGAGGMSVSPSVESLPAHRIPRRLRDKYPDRFAEATGSNNLSCWF